MIIFTLRLDLPDIAFFHLITHALFKALLFICAGNIIDIHHHSQDLRLIGNTISQLPTISTAVTIANLALCGAPFLAGFYSKDLIIESSTILIIDKNIIISIIFIIATILTTAYSTRFSIYILLSPTISPVSQYSSENYKQIIRVIALSLAAIVGGATTNWLFTIPVEEPNFNSTFKFIAPLIITSGVIIGAYMSTLQAPLSLSLTQLHCFI